MNGLDIPHGFFMKTAKKSGLTRVIHRKCGKVIVVSRDADLIRFKVKSHSSECGSNKK